MSLMQMIYLKMRVKMTLMDTWMLTVMVREMRETWEMRGIMLKM